MTGTVSVFGTDDDMLETAEQSKTCHEVEDTTLVATNWTH